MAESVESDIKPTETTETEIQSAEITFKTIAQEVFKMTLPLSTTIGAIKEQIFKDKGENFEIERQKLIYSGKVLNDLQTLEDVKVDEKKFVVVMVSKKKAEQPIYPSSSSSNVSAAIPTTESVQTPLSTGLTVTPEQEETIMLICGMGYERDQTIKALCAAYWNADRAVEYLCTAIPETAETVNQAGGLSPDSGDNPLAFLNDIPQFAQIAEIIRSRPDMLPQIMQQISATNPELINAIRSHPESFLQMINQGGQSAGSGQLPSLDQVMGMLGGQEGQSAGGAAQLPDQLMQMLGGQGGQAGGNAAQLQGLTQLLQMLGGEGGQPTLNATQLQGLDRLMQILGQAGGQAGGNAGQLPGLDQLMQTLGQGVQAAGNAAQVPQPVAIPVTEEDRSAIQRLQAMGFDEQTVIEAYFACDKNEELAVNYILSRMGDSSDNSDN
jgi:UV excision repair protein RAD23